MLKFEFKNGKTLAFEEFPIIEKNLRKINIVRNGQDSEGVWAAFNDEGIKLYDNDHRSVEYDGVCILQNDPLHFYPASGWGAYVPVKFRGSSRATLDMADMDGDMLFCAERIEADKEEEEAKTRKVRAKK